MRTVTRISQLTVAAALGLSLAACGSSSSSGGSTSAGQAATSSAAGQSDGASSAPGSSASSSSSESSASSGSSDQAGVPDATSLVHAARAAYNSAKSANMHADIIDSKGARQKTDIKGTLDGTNQEVLMDQGATKGVATIRTVSSKYYMKGDKTFWTKGSGAPKSAASLLTGKWVIMPSEGAGSFAELTIKNFLDQVMGPKAVTDAELKKAKTAKTTYQGKPAYVITSAKATNKNTITIDAATKHVLEVDGDKGSSATGKGKVTITQWDTQPRISKPAGAIELPSSLK